MRLAAPPAPLVARRRGGWWGLFARRHWLLMGLVVSLGLNLLLGGLLAESRIMPRWAAPDRLPGQAVIKDIAARLPAADADILRETYAHAHIELTRVVAEQRRSHDRLKLIMTALPFDTVAFEQEMARSRDQHQAITALMAETMRQALEAMSPQGRAAFAREFKLRSG